MNELMKVSVNENQEPCISGRDLHEFLEVVTPYHIWFPRMVDYGFAEVLDFCTEMFESTGGRPSTDHVIKLDMAKELAMIQRTERGKQARQYFIAVEKEFNSPERLMARALKVADDTIKSLQLTNTIQLQQIAELQPKADYTDRILKSKSLVTTTQIAKDYGMSANRLNKILHELSIQYKQSGQWLLYSRYHDKGYTHSETIEYENSRGFIQTTMHTKWTQKGRLFLYELLKNEGILPLIEQ